MERDRLDPSLLQGISIRSGSKADEFFERPPSQDYLAAWKKALSEPEPDTGEPSEILSVVIFRLGKEWLALATACCKEVTHRRPVHTIPHRSGRVFQGVVNLEGELRLYVALHELLQIETSIEFQNSRMPYQRNRMMTIAKAGEIWAFPVDEIDGIQRLDTLKIENVPVNVAKCASNFFRGIVRIHTKCIGLLDEELLFSSLKRSLQ